jgi:RNA polymerase sigma-70 factor, ECF subfamily
MDRVPEAATARTDQELFTAAKASDYDAFEEIVRRYHTRIFRLAYGMTKSELEAQEVVQDTFLNLFRGLPTFRAESSPGSWIFRIAANNALMHLRRKRRKPLLSLEDASPGELEGSNIPAGLWPAGDWSRQPEEQLLSTELSRHLTQAIDKLPEKYRLVVLLRDVEGLSNEETATSLGLTVPTVKARLHRSRMFLRGELDRYFAEGS